MDIEDCITGRRSVRVYRQGRISDEVIARGIEKRMPLVEFPWQLAVIARSSCLLPSTLYDKAVVQALKRKSRRQ